MSRKEAFGKTSSLVQLYKASKEQNRMIAVRAHEAGSGREKLFHGRSVR